MSASFIRGRLVNHHPPSNLAFMSFLYASFPVSPLCHFLALHPLWVRLGYTFGVVHLSWFDRFVAVAHFRIDLACGAQLEKSPDPWRAGNNSLVVKIDIINREI